MCLKKFRKKVIYFYLIFKTRVYVTRESILKYGEIISQEVFVLPMSTIVKFGVVCVIIATGKQ